MSWRELTSLLCGLVVAASVSCSSTAGDLTTGLSTDRIAITSNFTGTQITLFGAVENLDRTAPEKDNALSNRDYDVVVVLHGPEQNITVRRKDRIMGIWLNADSYALQAAPSSLYILTSAPLSAIATPETIASHQLSLNARVPQPSRQTGTESFEQALIRLKTNEKLYGIAIHGVTFLSDVLFRASVDVPASIPVGPHEAEVYLLRSGEVIAKDTQPIVIEKQGLEEAAHTLAYEHGFLYGLLAVLMAFLLGWLANVIFRKD